MDDIKIQNGNTETDMFSKFTKQTIKSNILTACVFGIMYGILLFCGNQLGKSDFHGFTAMIIGLGYVAFKFLYFAALIVFVIYIAYKLLRELFHFISHIINGHGQCYKAYVTVNGEKQEELARQAAHEIEVAQRKESDFLKKLSDEDKEYFSVRLKIAYNDGYDEGYNDGRRRGYDQGQVDGYSSGKKSGRSSWI